MLTFQPSAHFDPDVEEALIGQVLANPDALSDALAHCVADDFGWEPHARIFESSQITRDEGMAVTPLTIKARLSGEITTQIEHKSGLPALAYLETLAGKAMPFQRVPDLAKLVSDLAQRRRIDAELDAARQRLAANDRPIMDCIAGVIEATGEAAMRAQARNYLPPGEAVDAVLHKAQDALNGKPTPAIRTGLVRVDEITGGFHAGDLVIVAGRPGMGKSIFLTTVCKSAAEAGAPALLFSLEMPREQIIQRLIADCDYGTGSDDPLAYTRFRSGKFTAGQFDRAILAGERVKRLGIEIIDTPALTIAAISALAERFATKHKRLGVVAIDYLQICAPSDRYKGAKVQEVTEISNGAKALAKRIGWPVVIGSQLNRGVESRGDVKRPRLADLRESGAIEQDADVVLGLFREAYYVEEKRPAFGPQDSSWSSWKAEYDAVRNDLDIVALKNRNGPTGLARCHIEIVAGAIRNRRDEHQSERFAA